MTNTMISDDHSNKRGRWEKEEENGKVSVTLLAGFLGSGKSTLLKHILESKRKDDGGEGFRCAVIVNDMAELNIDGDLIESTGLIQSEEVVTMQNGCVCCNLSGDLVDQMTNLAKQQNPKFDYMIIEASGVSEPAAIAALFETCDEDHDHSTHEHEITLSDVAQLDTLVTVVDSAQFFHNLENKDTIQAPRLLMDQVEYSNVVILNKMDLVSTEQLHQVRDHVAALNSKAKIITCKESAVDVSEVIHTGKFKAEDFDLEDFAKVFESEKPKSCCKASIARGESACCLRARTIDSELSKVLLPPKKNGLGSTRHGENYQIASFVYKARRPFHPKRFHEEFVDPFFLVIDDEDEEDEDDDEASDDGTKLDKDEDDSEKKDGTTFKELQQEGLKKMTHRSNTIGNLLRMKGFLWKASAHDLIGYISIAGNVLRLESPGKWNCLDEKAYNGTETEKARLRKNWDATTTLLGSSSSCWGDRRQELVFIGKGLKHEEIQRILDSCLLSESEMDMGVDCWKALFGDVFLNAGE